MTASRPVLIDLTYVAARLHAPTPTGIERVDAAFARHFAGNADAGAPDRARAVHYGLARPHLLGPARAGALVRQAETAWQPADGWQGDPVYAALDDWLRGEPRRLPPQRGTQNAARGIGIAGHLARLRWRLAHDRRAVLPQGAVYLNVAQYAFEYPQVFRWLDGRPDVTPVFFIHDLLPLDHPEFFRDGYAALFERRVATMARFARAAIVSSAAVAARVAEEMRRRGRDPLPILGAALPPPTEGGDDGGGAASAVPGEPAPYFVMVGTIEPRKNHLGVLHAWRMLAAEGGPLPRLVLVGARGWENEQVVDLLERDLVIAPHVAEVSAISTPALHRLMRGARAVLMPSFAEGYGLPVAEALAAGTPVIAADIPVFREISQGRALLLDPTDGPRWREAIAAFSMRPSPRRDSWAAAAQHYAAPTWPAYFAQVEAFLADLPALA